MSWVELGNEAWLSWSYDLDLRLTIVSFSIA